MIDLQGPHERALIKIENAIVKKILSNVPPPNAPSTIRQKGSSKTLIDTGEMMGHVTHRQTVQRGQIVGEVGIFDPEIAKRARYNEYGTRDIPARPFLRPAFDETAPKAADDMANEIWAQIKKQMWRR